jgi:hypothetical protein
MQHFPLTRPVTTSLKPDSVSDIIIRNAPLADSMISEIKRIAMDGARLTFSSSDEYTAKVFLQIKNGNVFDYSDIQYPQRTLIPARNQGGKPRAYLPGLVFTVILSRPDHLSEDPKRSK